MQRRRPPPAAETGRSCWDRGLQDASAAQGTKQMQGAATRTGCQKGRIASITQALTQYNKKPPVLRIPGAFCLVLGECPIPGFDHVELRGPAFGLEGVCALGLHDALLRFPSVGGDFCCYFSKIL